MEFNGFRVPDSEQTHKECCGVTMLVTALIPPILGHRRKSAAFKTALQIS